MISSSDFFNPDYEVRRPGAAGFISLDVNTTPYTPGDQTQGNVTWNHTAGGLVQTGLDLTPLVNLTIDAQLAAYTRTSGDTLTFGRQLDVTTTGIIGAFGGTVTGLTNDVLGASAINSWASTATVGGLSLSQGVHYNVSFDVTAGAGINLNALSAANFALSSGGNPIENIDSIETLNVLNILQVGGGLATINFEFIAQSPLTELTFDFDAATIANVSLLGTVSGNQTVLQFSNMSLAPVPEASSLFLLAAGMLFQLRRHRRYA
ncbi:hypothetical protein [Brevifollis gellanilyticus]|uniref:Ice-binding protein C-terminal domain-containing protein n=1 Tax=Brevifollis gellanilyticus TaxID=748831 RepID=A0A512M969_9BACT|nr:hypothetical protein [Brevifollis gellanilyticus]GEP43272.1 hypothetical protein BGE01nite_25630 [Brevifollis gellanilyticus]